MFNISWKFLVAFSLFYGNLFALQYRNALQMPESYIVEINDFARNVNTSTDLRLMGVGSYLDKGDTVVCAFSKEKTIDNVANVLIDEVVNRIAQSFSNKEIVLTGYGAAARYAGAVASKLCRKPMEANQLKLITFCANGSLDRLSSMCLSCKLNFSHRFSEHNFLNNPWIELPISLSSEVCSMRSTIAGIAGGLFFGTIGNFCGKMLNLGTPFTCVCATFGAIATTIEVARCCSSEYLPSEGVKSIFVLAKQRSWSADTESELRSLGQ